MAPWHPTSAGPFVHPDTHHLVQPGEFYDIPRGEEEADEAGAEAPAVPVKLPAAEWPAREALDAQFKAAELKVWATAQELEFPASINKGELLDLIEAHRPKLADGN